MQFKRSHLYGVRVLVVAFIATAWLGCQNPRMDPTQAATSGERAAAPEQAGPVAGQWKEWLEPFPADQPQPRFACARPEYTAEPVWYDRRITYSWEVANEGEAPLKLHVRT